MSKKSFISIILIVGVISFILGMALANASSDFATNFMNDVKNRQVDLDDRYAVVITPESQRKNIIIIVNRKTAQFYKADLTEIKE